MMTLWHPDGIMAAVKLSEDTLRRCSPATVHLHTWSPDRAAEAVRRILPRVKISVGVGIDSIARNVAQGAWGVSRGVREFRDLGRRAADAGGFELRWNAEASWKRASKRLDDLIPAALADVRADRPKLAQTHSAYDHPTYHSTYRWRAWLGQGSPIVASFPQVYAAPGDGVMAHRGALAAREARALSSWRDAVRKGWIREDAPAGTEADLTDCDWLPYFQLHHVPTAATVEQAVKYPVAGFWALPTRSDADGRAALVALHTLHRLGFWGPTAIVDFQASRGLKPDGKVGPLTLGELAKVQPSTTPSFPRGG